MVSAVYEKQNRPNVIAKKNGVAKNALLKKTFVTQHIMAVDLSDLPYVVGELQSKRAKGILGHFVAASPSKVRIDILMMLRNSGVRQAFIDKRIGAGRTLKQAKKNWDKVLELIPEDPTQISVSVEASPKQSSKRSIELPEASLGETKGQPAKKQPVVFV